VADDLLLEVGLGAGDWANISDRIYDRSEITITRGLQSEDGTAGPGQLDLSLKNADGMFSVRNPTSPLFGLLGRNAPIRLSYGRGKKGLVIRGGSNGAMKAPDSVPLSIVGDLDVRVDLELLDDGNPHPDWTWTAAGFDLANKYSFFTNQISWAFYLIAGKPYVSWSADGSTTNTLIGGSALAGPTKGRRALRFTLDVDNGAGGRTATFYQAPTLAGPWTVVSGPTTSAGVTSIFDSPTDVRVGASPQSSTFTWGRSGPVVVYGAEVRNGINGTVVASPVPPSAQLDPVPFAAGTFNDAQGNVWTPTGSPDAARIWYGDVDIRFTGELAALPNRFSVGLHDKWVPITANGVLRRYGQGKAPTASGLRDFTLSPARASSLASYYPLSGAEGTTYSLNIGSTYYLKTQFYGVGVSGVAPVFKYGVDLGSDAVGTGMEINATGVSYMHGEVGTGYQNVAFDFVFQSAGLGVLTAQIQDYNLNLWAVTLNTSTDDGTAQVSFTDPEVGPIGYAATAVLPELQDGRTHTCRLQITTSGSDSTYKLFIDGVQVATGNNTGYIMRGLSVFRLFYSRYVNQTYVNVGHLTVWSNSNAASIPAASDVAAAAFGYAGDTAADRMTRVATDGGIPLVIVGTPADTMLMGTLNSEPRLAQIRDAEATDLGILHEARDSASLLYRTRRSMVGQSPKLTLAFNGGQVMEPFQPLDDDQLTRNDVTATRRNGGEVRQTLTTGRMSVQDPPNGVGLYDDEVQVNTQTDALLVGIAAWLVNAGTVDRARYPSLSVELAAAAMDPVTTAAVYATDVGDAVRITGASGIGEYDDLDMIVVGYTETIGQVLGNGKRKSLFTFVCRPGELYKAARYGTARYDTGGTTLTTGVNATALSMSLTTAPGKALWTTAPAAFPLDLWVNGERVTVTGITGASSPQTATIGARSVNGVVKAQPAGATVRLFDTPRYAL
jgi:hypothetical protein